jgi:flagellar motor component MotA
MDIAALLGFLGAVGMILAAMIAGGGIAPFVDNQSIMIVFGGSFFCCHVFSTHAHFSVIVQSNG